MEKKSVKTCRRQETWLACYPRWLAVQDGFGFLVLQSISPQHQLNVLHEREGSAGRAVVLVRHGDKIDHLAEGSVLLASKPLMPNIDESDGGATRQEAHQNEDPVPVPWQIDLYYPREHHGDNPHADKILGHARCRWRRGGTRNSDVRHGAADSERQPRKAVAAEELRGHYEVAKLLKELCVVV